MNHYSGTSGHNLVNFVFLRNIWFFFLNKVLIFKKEYKNQSLLKEKICGFIRPNVYQEDKLCTISKETFFTSDEISLLSCKKIFKNFLHF